MTNHRRILVFQTAFPGDVVLTLSLLEHLRASFPEAYLAIVTIPGPADLLQDHPAVSEQIVYDKRGADRGIRGILRIARTLRARNFDTAIVPHRSLRSALVVYLANIPRRIGYDRSSGRFLLTDLVAYDPSAHETERNLSLLRPLGNDRAPVGLPSLYPGYAKVQKVDTIIREWRAQGGSGATFIALAPGSVWATKRWPADRFAALGRMFAKRGYALALIGGSEDRRVCGELVNLIGSRDVLNAAGDLSLLESAELIRRCGLLVSNDSAPMHLAVAMRVPVVAIFGPTVPHFGFGPRGVQDVVVERNGLSCRPCGIHGGRRCPIGTFECMLSIPPSQVFETANTILRHQ
jgi:heptosyltransferase-2